jgi:hypothetical protein
MVATRYVYMRRFPTAVLISWSPYPTRLLCSSRNKASRDGTLRENGALVFVPCRAVERTVPGPSCRDDCAGAYRLIGTKMSVLGTRWTTTAQAHMLFFPITYSMTWYLFVERPQGR